MTIGVLAKVSIMKSYLSQASVLRTLLLYILKQNLCKCNKETWLWNKYDKHHEFVWELDCLDEGLENILDFRS